MGKRLAIAFMVCGVVCMYWWLSRPAELDVPPAIGVEIAESHAEEWTEYTPPSGGFVVTLPVRPHHVSDVMPVAGSDDPIHYDLYLARSSAGTTLMIHIIRYPASFDTSDPGRVLDTVVQGMVAKSEQNQLTTSEPREIQGCPAVDFLIRNPEAAVQGRAILQGQTLYVLSVADQSQERLASDFMTLSESFHIVP